MSLAFGLTVLTMAFAVGDIGAQVLGGTAAAEMLHLMVSGTAGFSLAVAKPLATRG